MLDDNALDFSAITETKHDRFLRLAPKRVENALHALDIVARLAVPQNEWTQDEASRMVEALRQRVDEIERAMLKKEEERKPFSFG